MDEGSDKSMANARNMRRFTRARSSNSHDHPFARGVRPFDSRQTTDVAENARLCAYERRRVTSRTHEPTARARECAYMCVRARARARVCAIH